MIPLNHQVNVLNDQLLLNLPGHQGDDWVDKSFCLPVGKYVLAFEATVGMLFKSDIAQDGVHMRDEECEPKPRGKSI